MCRDVDMEAAAPGVVNDHKDVEQTEGCRDGDTEVASRNRLRMVAHKRGPALGRHAWPRTPAQVRGHIFAYGARRNLQAELEPQFIGDALLPPCRVVTGHLANQRLQLCRNPWPSSTRLPAPE